MITLRLPTVRFALLALALTMPAAAAAAPPDATVFIRVKGELHGEIQHAWKETVEVRDVEIGTGSGFVVSPGGYILTNHHVVSAGERVIQREGRSVTVQVEVTAIEVLFPADGTRLQARVEAADPEMDLAVLSVPGGDLPFIGLGDSDALRAGQPVQVVGFPLGRAVDVGRRSRDEGVPQPTVSRGSVAAVRSAEEGDARYIQTDAAVHPGSSGGPMLDEQGYAVGVIRMAIARRTGLAFAIPINRVKDFLQANGLDRVFPTRRLTLGPPQSFEGKGLRLRVPDAFEDASPSRLRVEWAPADEVGLHIERVATPLPLADVEEALLSGNVFSAFAAAAPVTARPVRLGGRAGIAGWAQGVSASGEPLEMGYALADLGREKVVARYAGPASHVAFNRSVFAASLESLEADPLLTAEVAAPVTAAFERGAFPYPRAPELAWPARWHREPGEGPACAVLPPPDAALTASPEGDFTVTVRAMWWRALAPEGRQALDCGWGPRAWPAYGLRDDRLGVRRITTGMFLPRADGLLRVEVETPLAKEPFVRDLVRAWTEAVAREEAP